MKGGSVLAPKVPLKTITLLGQAASGKTNLLSAFANHEASCLDLEEGPDKVSQARVVAEFDSGSAGEGADYDLSRHYVNILKGRESANESTNIVRRYSFQYSFGVPVPDTEPQPRRFGWLRGNRPTSAPKAITRRFEVVDGRGADAAPERLIEKNDEVTLARRQDYRDGMDDSIGLIVLMPLMSDDEGSDAMIASRFVAELQDAIRRKDKKPDEFTKLRNIALCFTKCEQAFVHDDVDGLIAACDPERYKTILKDNALLSQFRDVIVESLQPDRFDLRVFPVSTFGFVHRVGHSNFYDWDGAPGLLTRAVDEFDDYGNHRLPDFKDHFPFPVTDNQALSMWRPFNIAPPLFYALRGMDTGPISLSAQDALKMA